LCAFGNLRACRDPLPGPSFKQSGKNQARVGAQSREIYVHRHPKKDLSVKQSHYTAGLIKSHSTEPMPPERLAVLDAAFEELLTLMEIGDE